YLYGDNFYASQSNCEDGFLVGLGLSAPVSKKEKFNKVYSYFRGKSGLVISFSLDLAFYLNVLRCARLVDLCIVCRFISNPEREFGSVWISGVKARLAYHFIGRSDEIIAQSDAMRELLSKHLV